MSLDECILTEQKQCADLGWRYIEFFSGNELKASYKTSHEAGLKFSKNQVEIAKRRLRDNQFSVVGILEQFEDTLELFEYMMPSFYGGVVEIYNSEKVQTTKNQTRSLNHKPLSVEAEKKLRTDVLLYEHDLYDFARALFNERYRIVGEIFCILNVDKNKYFVTISVARNEANAIRAYVAIATGYKTKEFAKIKSSSSVSTILEPNRASHMRIISPFTHNINTSPIHTRIKYCCFALRPRYEHVIKD